jgi:hypothetical protein
MGVKVTDRLAAIFPLVDHEPISVRKPLLLGDLSRRIEDVKVVPGVLSIGKSSDFGAGRDDDMDGRLRRNVSEGNHMIVFVDDLSRDLAIDDPRE